MHLAQSFFFCSDRENTAEAMAAMAAHQPSPEWLFDSCFDYRLDICMSSLRGRVCNTVSLASCFTTNQAAHELYQVNFTPCGNKVVKGLQTYVSAPYPKVKCAKWRTRYWVVPNVQGLVEAPKLDGNSLSLSQMCKVSCGRWFFKEGSSDKVQKNSFRQEFGNNLALPG